MHVSMQVCEHAFVYARMLVYVYHVSSHNSDMRMPLFMNTHTCVQVLARILPGARRAGAGVSRYVSTMGA